MLEKHGTNSIEIVALSPAMKDGIVGKGFEENKVHVIPNGCDFELFDVPPGEGASFRASTPWLQSRPLVVYAGTIGLVNGISYLVKLAAAVADIDPDVRFLVVGDGREAGHVRALATDLGILNRSFFMMPPVPKRDVPRILAAATVTASLVIPNPALSENSANKFFDSLAASRPIAINHGGWMAQMISEHDVGLVLDPTDVDAGALSSCAAFAMHKMDSQRGQESQPFGKTEI